MVYLNWPRCSAISANSCGVTVRLESPRAVSKTGPHGIARVLGISRVGGAQSSAIQLDRLAGTAPAREGRTLTDNPLYWMGDIKRWHKARLA
jgi:hypothetical protein